MKKIFLFLCAMLSLVGCDNTAITEPKKPDLIATFGKVTDAQTHQVVKQLAVHDRYAFEFNVENLNSSQAPASNTEAIIQVLEVAKDGASTLLGTHMIPIGALEIGQSESGSVALTFSQAGTYKMVITADADNKIEESDETNNEAYAGIEDMASKVASKTASKTETSVLIVTGEPAMRSSNVPTISFQ